MLLFRLSLAAGGKKSRLFCADDRIIFRFLIDLKPGKVFFRDRHIRKDRLDRAFGYAGVAINTTVRIDQQPIG